MSAVLGLSIILTLAIGGTWKVVSNRKHCKTGLWMMASFYVSLTGIYWLNNVPLGWLLLVSAIGGFLGLIFSSQGFRNVLFRSGVKENAKVEPKVKEVKQVREGKPQVVFSGDLKDCSTPDLIAELSKRGQIN